MCSSSAIAINPLSKMLALKYRLDLNTSYIHPDNTVSDYINIVRGYAQVIYCRQIRKLADFFG